MHEPNDQSDAGPNHEATIHIDRKEFKVDARSLTGAEIRNLPTPPVGEDRDLYLDVPGPTDRLIADDQRVELENGMRFFTAPRAINPGSPGAAGG